MLYSFLRPLLFQMDEEEAHHLALTALRYVPACCFAKTPDASVNYMGLSFAHRVGLAAGLDKNGVFLPALAKLGFSFIEIGTVTPKAQLGNPKPRLFRIPEAQAIINRMGFNNDGVDALIHHIQKANFQGVLGINIGKNKDTGLNQAVEDYLHCLQKVYPYASYITINISSPNTPDLRLLQQDDYFQALMRQLHEARLHLAEYHRRYVPLVIKLSPDESEEQLKRMAEVMLEVGIEGIIATNTTIDHRLVESYPFGEESGGVSGQPLFSTATHQLRVLKAVVGDAMTLIGVGGIDSAETANQKMNAGADLLQLYTGLIYQGPGLIQSIVEELAI